MTRSGARLLICIRFGLAFWARHRKQKERCCMFKIRGMNNDFMMMFGIIGLLVVS